MLDAIRAFEEGVGTIEAIDAGFRLGAGHPMGPLTLNDFVGLETLSRAARGHVRRVPRRRFATPPLLRKMIAAGWYGKKTGLGFYDWSGDEPVPEPADRPAEDRLMTDPGSTRRRDAARARRRARSATTRRPPSRASCRSASGSRCCSTRARSPRRRCSPTGTQDGLGADGVVTGIGDDRAAARSAVMANDPTVKAGSWGPKTVEKIIRIQERALEPADADGLPRRLGRRADHRPGADVPRAAAAPGGSSTTRSSSPAWCRRSACCSARAPPAAPTSRPSATS